MAQYNADGAGAIHPIRIAAAKQVKFNCPHWANSASPTIKLNACFED